MIVKKNPGSASDFKPEIANGREMVGIAIFPDTVHAQSVDNVQV